MLKEKAWVPNGVSPTREVLDMGLISSVCIIYSDKANFRRCKILQVRCYIQKRLKLVASK